MKILFKAVGYALIGLIAVGLFIGFVADAKLNNGIVVGVLAWIVILIGIGAAVSIFLRREDREWWKKNWW